MCLDLMNLRSDSVVDHTLLYYQHNLQKYRTPLWIHRFLGLLACCMRTVYSCLLHCCMRSCKRKNISGKKRKQCFNIYSQVLRLFSLSALEISKLISPSTAHYSSGSCSGQCYVFQSLFALTKRRFRTFFKAKKIKGTVWTHPICVVLPAVIMVL